MELTEDDQARPRGSDAGRQGCRCCLAALRNRGITALLDAVVEFLPSPVDRRRDRHRRDESAVTRPSDDNAACALAFKVIMVDGRQGGVLRARLLGRPARRATRFNPRRIDGRQREREGIDRSDKMKRASAQRGEICSRDPPATGDIGAAPRWWPEDVTTGDTLCDRARIVTLESIDFPAGDHRRPSGQDQRPTRRRCIALSRRPPRIRRSARTDRNRADHHRRHGRAAPGDHRRPHEARVRRGNQRRQAQVVYRERRSATAGRRKGIRASVRPAGPVRPRLVLGGKPAGSRQGLRKFVDAIRAVWCRASHPRRRKGRGRSLPNGVLAGYPVVDVKVC